MSWKNFSKEYFEKILNTGKRILGKDESLYSSKWILSLVFDKINRYLHIINYYKGPHTREEYTMKYYPKMETYSNLLLKLRELGLYQDERLVYIYKIKLMWYKIGF